MINLTRCSLLALLAAILLVNQGAMASAAPQGRSLREGISTANLRFVGATDGGAAEARLSRDDVAFLVTARRPISLNEIIAGGIPVRTSRVQQLIEWGLLQQTGMRFVSRMPVLIEGTTEEFLALVDKAVERVLPNVETELLRLSDRVWRHPGVPTLPVLTAWILRELAWEQVAGRTGIDLRSFIAEQRQFQPERGFWGVLWYIDTPRPPAYRFYQVRRGDYTIQICWSWNESADPFGQQDGPTQLQRFLQKLKDDGRKINNPEQFPGALEAGLISSDKKVRALARKYRPSDEDGLARLIDDIAATIGQTILATLPRRQLAETLGHVADEFAVTVAYTELIPRLVRKLEARGVFVMPGDERTDWTAWFLESGGGDEERDDTRESLRITILTDRQQEENTVPVVVAVPRFSAIIWKGLTMRPIIELPW